jgi:dephospho-CoA kinase
MESLVDKTLVVTISDEVRIERLKKRDNVNTESIKKVLQAQWPQSKKVKRADFVVNNDGSIEQLRKQIVGIINEVAPTLLK